jgi:nucleotide-binding universal stress UspA family protein
MAAQARNILIAFDGSEASRRALDVAARLTGYGSTLTVVSVGREGDGGVATALADAHERLLGRQLTATYLERLGEPAAEIVEAARALEADLVVVGRRNENLRAGRPVPGSVSAAVVRDAPCDVLVVR